MTVAVPEVVFISPVVGILAFVLGVYIIMLNPYLGSTRAFFVAMMFGSLTAFLNFMLVNAANEAQALALGRLVLALLIMFHASLLYLTAFLPYKRDDDWLLRRKGRFWAASTVLAVAAGALVERVEESAYGWGIPESPVYLLLVITIVSITAIALQKLLSVVRESDSRKVRVQCVLMMAGLLSPLAWDLTMAVEERLGSNWPPEMAVGYVPTLAAFVYVIMQHRLFLVSPVEEETISLEVIEDEWDGVKEGCCYLVEGKRPDEAYQLLLRSMAQGAQALVITRNHPDIVREQYGLVRTPIIWLASQPGPERMDPTSLSMMQHTVTEFARKGEDVLILIDGLEYLITNNPMDRVLKLIYALKDEILLANAKLVVPLDPEVLEERDLALFEREFEVLGAE